MDAVKHDDFCPCTRFRAQPEFCRCGAIERREIVEETVQAFSDRLREINQTPAPMKTEMGK
jgi:predicted ATPase with chaperone activity